MVEIGLSGRVADCQDRLFKFPQMDFEMAIWEMTSLLIAPKKVFKSIYYHVSVIGISVLSKKLANNGVHRNVREHSPRQSMHSRY